ncbi:MAG TPA: hypothetical protein VHE99_05765 [Gammaproteobacteria bacterium]|nr:hypothetical protein [Gammaproteobacteria bacterium]
MPTTNKLQLSIWSFVGFILMIYGIIIAGAGVYYLFKPDTQTVLYQLNPSLWWGIFLLVVGLIFYVVDLKRRR